jgi:mono/diheme cytochrome c family protein
MHVRPGAPGRHRPVTLLATLSAALLLLAACEQRRPGADEIAALRTAPLPPEHASGEALFNANCAVCHGSLALGTRRGPPLVNQIYAPDHHADEAFQIAVARGVRAHHFRFGNMPAVPGVSRAQVDSITGYVRWLQRTAGIE